MKFIFIIFTLIFNLILAYASDPLFYCTDFSCQEPISTGKTLLRYSAKTDKHLSFAKNEDIKILSKPVDDGDDWIGFARGKVGLVPKSMVRELKIIKYDSQFKFPFQQLPFWGAPVKLRESSENYVETEEKASNTPPILDIHPGTASPSLLKSDEVEGEVNTASSLPTESPEEVAKTKEAPANDPPQDIAKVQDTNQAPTDEAQKSSKPVEEEQPLASPKVVPKMSPEELKEQEVNSVEIEAEKPIVPEVNKDELSKPEIGEAQKVEALKEELKDVEQGGIIPEELQDLPRDGSSEQAEEIFDEGYDTEDEPQDVSEQENNAGEESDKEAEPEETKESEASESKMEPEPVEVKKEPEPVEVKKEAEPVEVKTEASEIKSEPPEIKIEEPKTEESVEISTKEEPQIIKESTSEPTKANSEAEAKKEEAINEDENPEIESTTTSIFSAVKGFTSSVMNLLPEDLRDGDGTPSVTTEAAEQVPAEPLQKAQDVPLEVNYSANKNQDNLEKPAENSEKPSVMSDEQEVSKKETPPTTSLPENPAPEETTHSSATELPAEVTEELKLETTASSVASEEATVVPIVIPTEIPVVAPIVPNEKDDLQLTASPAPSESPVSESTPIPEVLQATTETATEAAPEVSVTEKPELTATEAVPEVTELPEVPPTVPAVEILEEDSHHYHDHDHDHHHHHHHHHHHKTYDPKDDSSSWSIIIVVKHLSGTLLSLLPEHLQDSILDVDSALVFTGIIALMLVSICVPYFVIESIVAVRPLKKQVVELNKSLWKVSAAYENQQEEFDTYKKKALAYDEDQKRIEQLEMELQILKKLEAKQKEQVKLLQKQLKTSAKAADGIEDLIEGSIKEKEIAIEERNRLQANYNALQATLKEKLEELESAQASGSALALDLEVVNHERENLSKRLASLETELELTRSKLTSEAELRRAKVEENDSLTKERDSIQAELLDLRRILHQYEENVGTMTDELTAKENELQALKETLGEDSPLIDISETKAKLKSAEEDAASLKSRCETVAFENASLTKNLEDTKTQLELVRTRKEEAENNLKVLEGYFKKKEEDLRMAVAKLELEQQIKHKDKDDLVKMIREKESEVLMLISTNEGLKGEIEDMKGSHRNDLRKLESKADEHWLSLCQTERKYAEARKECELLRQKLVALAKEKDGGDDDRMSAIGDVPMFSFPPDMVPPPPLDDLAPPSLSYFPLDDDFNPPPPLPLGSDPIMRPPPLGRLSPTSPNNNYSSYMDEDDDAISPIDRASAGGRGDYSEDSSGSDSPDHRRPGSRDNWINDNRRNDRHPPNRRRRGGGGGGGGSGHHHHGNGPKTSSPLPHGVNC